MTKGKYAARAALRREDNSIQSQIESYQHHIKRLTTEILNLQEQLTTAKRAAAQEIRQLKVQLNEGLSPEIITLRSQLQQQRDMADKAVREQQELRKLWHKVFGAMITWFREAYGCTGHEALEAAMAVLGYRPDVTLTGPEVAFTADTGDDEELERVRQIQAVQGFRRPRLALGERPKREPASERKKDRWRESR